MLLSLFTLPFQDEIAIAWQKTNPSWSKIDDNLFSYKYKMQQALFKLFLHQKPAWVKTVNLNMSDQTTARPIPTLMVRSLITTVLFHTIDISLQSMTTISTLKCGHPHQWTNKNVVRYGAYGPISHHTQLNHPWHYHTAFKVNYNKLL